MELTTAARFYLSSAPDLARAAGPGAAGQHARAVTAEIVARQEGTDTPTPGLHAETFERILRLQFDVQRSKFEMTMHFLFKEEPTHYSFDAFVKDGGTTWTGVRNPVAQRHLRSVRKGDLVLYYHTGNEKAIVGIAKATANAYPDPGDRTGRAYVVDLVPVKKLAEPVTLARVKSDKRFASFPLTRIPRLSVMPVTENEWAALLAMSERA